MNGQLDPACRVHVLAVSPSESDHVVLAHIFGHTAWGFESVRTFRDASERLFVPRLVISSPVILCDETLPDGTWKDLLALSKELPARRSLIVTSDCADDRLWAEVLSLGAYDVLQRPFRSQEVFRTIGLAWAHSRKSCPTPEAPVHISASAIA